MAINNVSFDDPSDEPLDVFSGNDLVLAHHDEIDLDWREVSERVAIDERRGLVVLQVSVLEDLIDNFIMYLADDPDQDGYYEQLVRRTIGPRIDRLEQLMRDAGLTDVKSLGIVEDLRKIARRRNQLAHGTIRLRPIDGVRIFPPKGDIQLEWVIESRRSPTPERLTMLQLREDLHEAIGCFMAMLDYATHLFERTPKRQYFKGGRHLGLPK
jgi:hypothetical protein